MDEAAGRMVGGGGDASKIDLEHVRDQALSYADRIVERIDVAATLFARDVGTVEGEMRALEWRILAAEDAYQLAAQARPVAALADMVALCTYQHHLHESYWKPIWHEPDDYLHDAWAGLRQEGLDTVKRLLPEEQSKVLGEMIAAWEEQLADPQELLRAGSPRFSELAGQTKKSTKQVSLLGFMGLDPLDSLEPAAREVARTRELAERAVFLAQRASRTLSWRLQLLTLRLANVPETKGVLADIARVSQAAEDAVTAAGELPAKLRAEGDALLQQVSAELTAQRTGLVTDLERASEPTRALLAQTEETLDAGTRLAAALDVTTRAVDEFIAHVAPDEPDGAEPDTPGKPFDPVEYTALAAQVTAGLQELNAAVANLERTRPQAQHVLDDAATRIDQSVERAYGLALRLVLIAIGAVTAAMLLVRWLSGRRRGLGAP